MEIFLASLFGAGIILAIFYVKFPYFLQDCRYIMKMRAVRSKRMKFRERKPFYSILECFLDRVCENPDKPFIVFEDQVYSYKQVELRSNQVARALQLHSGSTVALLLGNEPALVWVWLGLFQIGCSVSMLNTNIRNKSLLHCFNCCGASVLIAGAEQRKAVCEVMSELTGVCVYILGDTEGMEGLHNLSEKIQQQPNTPVPYTLRENITMSSPGLYIFTSGTTGLPKAGLCPQDRIWSPVFFQFLVGVMQDDVIYITLPLYHAAGLLIGLGGAIERGITVVLRRKFSVSQFWNDCRKHNVTVIQYIGEIMRYLCNTPKRGDDRDHQVRLALGNGMRSNVWEEFQRRFGNVEIKEFYAASDGNLSFINYTNKVGPVGRVSFYHRMMFPHAVVQFDAETEEPVRNREGHCVPVATGETGLLVVEITKLAPFVGYAGNPEHTERKKLRNVFVEGDVYFNSGDLLKIDKHNFLYFQDRVGETFRWKGENVSTTEVSDVIRMLDFIEDASVYGVEVPGNEGRIGMAAVTIKENREFDSREMFNHITHFLPVYTRPRFIRILECVEMTGTFKQVKVNLVKEGFNPYVIPQPLYILQENTQNYVPLTHYIYRAITTGKTQL
ncbi:long-chain fatty acid transport protein 2-like [Hoplias malabaricus]|uniref:long-chain fatty acid transport protein 2-like n=1 Tax=Hoplias malabaricus TaxID=27720 RepID=UPI003462F036